ncbi:sugar ABC transporter ATP-binding protein [Christensenella tenuis]|jgi:ribose transport system ATP-binding protein|uniref:Sugar ABC transporter ATP-binding protein n=1 Tax=Christensenella tenuis TaxID=2763033 RepID=A0ABR7EDV2_9FIRM|nr:sugar ABC transporter ATP-binding protein [Christensenella tenuis]MBC5647941.1 sugar ABC transporter ATP-binding protein [Christensenella tenuis]
MEEIILKCSHISKSFPGVKALDNVQLELRRGEVHALCGENGAGKSTVIKIITGLYQKDSGEIEYFGKKVNFKNTIECRKNGIALIPQELHLAETLTVAENIFMTNFPRKGLVVDWNRMNEQTRELQKRLGEAALSFQPDQLVKTLSMGQKQLVEIMKAISTDVKVIAFDEPTSSLSDEETVEMFKLIRQLTAEGIAIIYVSHRLAEIFEICDRVSVYKDGKYIGTKDVAEVEPKDIISMMVGRDVSLFHKTRDRKVGEPVFEVKDLCWKDRVKNVSFKLNKGEVLGMFGIVGSGRTETARTIFGIEKKDSGTIIKDGKELNIRRPEDAVLAKIGFVTEDRRGEGLSLVMSVAENITMPSMRRYVKKGVLDLKAEAAAAQKMVEMLAIKTPKLETRVGSLSGGNQQKIVISKWLGADSEILIFDEPTRGIDVGAKAEIYQMIDNLTQEGKSIIMISSELPEVLAMSDRLLVFRDGEIVAELAEVQSLSEEDVLGYAIKTV